MSERGSASVEWTGLVAVVLAALSVGGTAVAGGPALAGAAGLARAIRCAVLAGCAGEDARLERAYGADAAGYVRAFAPSLAYEPGTLTLPVDYRACRAHRCSDAAAAGGRDVWRSRAGRHATVFTRVVDRRGEGRDLFVQYWLYYPDSTWLGAARAAGRALASTPAGPLLHRASGHHADDWESYQVRISPRGRVLARASAHHGYAARRRWPNLDELPAQPPGRERGGGWTPATGWTRVSRGSHAGHIPSGAAGERRTESDGLVLVPIETLPPADRATPFAVTPPWRKPVYADPDRADT